VKFETYLCSLAVDFIVRQVPTNHESISEHWKG